MPWRSRWSARSPSTTAGIGSANRTSAPPPPLRQHHEPTLARLLSHQKKDHPGEPANPELDRRARRRGVHLGPPRGRQTARRMTSFTHSLSCTNTGVTASAQTSPRVSTSRCRFRPWTFFPRRTRVVRPARSSGRSGYRRSRSLGGGSPQQPAAPFAATRRGSSPRCRRPAKGGSSDTRSGTGGGCGEGHANSPLAGYVQDGVEDLTLGVLRRRTSRFGDERNDPTPLRVGQVRWI